MKKYTKHYMEIALSKLNLDEFFFEEMEIEDRDNEFLDKYFFDENLIKMLIEGKYAFKRYVAYYPEIITSGRPLAKIRFYDINYIDDNGLIYESNKHNYSNWICFGKRRTVGKELLAEDEECWCFNGCNNFTMKKEDVTFEEFMEKYFTNEKKANKVKKLG